MYCEKCGAEIEYGMIYCENCGTKVGESENSEKDEESDTHKQNHFSLSSSAKKIIYIVCAVLAAIIIFVIAIAAITKGTKKMNLNDYVTIETEGYNGYGKATASIDWNRIEEDYGDKLNITEKGRSSDTYRAMMIWNGNVTAMDFLKESVKGSLDQNSELENNDVITYVWNVDLESPVDYFNYKISFEDITYTVSGLEEIGQFDAFEGIEVEFSGVSPNGSAKLKMENLSEIQQSLKYSLDKTSGLSNGDAVTVTVSRYDDLNEFCASQCGMIPKETTKTFVIEKLDVFATQMSQITEDAINKMHNQAKDVITQSTVGWESHASVDDIAYEGMYFLSAKDNDEWYKNYVYIVEKITVTDTKSNDTFSYYYYVQFQNALIKADGSCEVDILTYDTPYGYVGWWTSGAVFQKNNLSYIGYQSLDEVYKDCVIKHIDEYAAESSIDMESDNQQDLQENEDVDGENMTDLQEEQGENLDEILYQ